MMKNYKESIEINHNPNWRYIPDHIYRNLTISGSGSGKTNFLLNLIKHQQTDIDKICLYVKDSFTLKYRLLFNEREKVEIKNLRNSIALINYSRTIDNVYVKFGRYSPTKKRRVIPTKKRRVIIVFDDMIPDMESNKKLSPITTELFLRERKINVSLVFISKSYFRVPKTTRINATHYFIMKIPNK